MEAQGELIQDIVRRIVAEAAPLRIVLFGSAARGEMGPDSDMDLLVVVRDGENPLTVAQRLHRKLRGLPCPKDIVVVLESDVERHAANPYLVLHTALLEGKEVYRAA